MAVRQFINMEHWEDNNCEECTGLPEFIEIGEVGRNILCPSFKKVIIK